MDNNQIESIEKDKKNLKKLWLFLIFFILLTGFLLYFRVNLGLGEKTRTITGAVVLAILIINNIFLIVKTKKRIKEQSEGNNQSSVSKNETDEVENMD